MTVEQISVFVENTPGRLAGITDILAASNIDIRAISISDTIDFGILRLIVDDPRKAQKALAEGGYMVSLTEVLAVALEDTPGSFSKICRILAGVGINLEYAYAFVTQKSTAYIILRLSDNLRGAAVLQEKGIKIAPQSIISTI